MSQNLKLEIVDNDATGSHLALPHGSYRAVVRLESDLEATQQLAIGGDRLLGDQATAIAERHLSQRASAPAHRLKMRRREPDLVLDDPGISRTHAMIFHGDQGLSIVDLMSTNGTLVNGEPISDADLQVDDIVKVGSTELIVRVRRD